MTDASTRGDGARERLMAEAAERILISDGAFGTQIQNRKLEEKDYAGDLGLTADQKGNNDLVNLTQPQVIRKICDSYIDAEGFGGIKLNALMAYGGVEAVERELSRLMNRPIRHHIVVRLDAIETLANLVGGIEVDVPKRLYYVDRSQNLLIDLQPGPQLLKGKDLEGFLRWRNDGRGDFGRLERQQLALKGLFEQMKQPQNLIRLPALITAAGQALETDLGPMELGGLVTAMGTTELKATSLRAVPFDADGISYLDTEWPAHSSTGADSGDPNGRRFRFLF